jgi:Kef-type K+ transport system membrane component KefB
MFKVGVDLDLRQLRKMGPAVVLTSNISILVPFLGGFALAWFLYSRLSSPTVPISVFAMFMGTAMSITAFPVLARILTERNLLHSKIGSIAISSAAVDDVTAWCLLALLLAKLRSHAGTPLWFTMGGLIAYVALMTCGVRPLMARITTFQNETISTDSLALVLLFAFLSAWITERLGIHALFGAFFAGLVLPRSEGLVHSVASKLETLSNAVLLPLFFAFTGLRTSVRLMSGTTLWFYCGLIIAVAVSGKVLGCMVAARSAEISWRQALSLGLLMNTRGLVELVILNVGLDLRVISPTLFSMMVVMALVTTFMTTPLLDLVA